MFVMINASDSAIVAAVHIQPLRVEGLEHV
jgi:hypothetical protein